MKAALRTLDVLRDRLHGRWVHIDNLTQLIGIHRRSVYRHLEALRHVGLIDEDLGKVRARPLNHSAAATLDAVLDLDRYIKNGPPARSGPSEVSARRQVGRPDDGAEQLPSGYHLTCVSIEHVAGRQEIADELGISVAGVRKWQERNPDYPEPLGYVSNHVPWWDLADVTAWREQHRPTWLVVSHDNARIDATTGQWIDE